MAVPDPHRYLSPQEAAARLSISRRTLDRKMREDRDPIPHYRVGRRVLIDLGELDRWVHRQRPVLTDVPGDVGRLLHRLAEPTGTGSESGTPRAPHSNAAHVGAASSRRIDH